MKTLRFSDATPELLDGIPSVRRRVAQRLHWINGEWFIDPEGGVRFLTILGRRLPAELIGGVLAQEATKVEDVLSTHVLSTVQRERDVEVELEVESIFGTFVLTQTTP